MGVTIFQAIVLAFAACSPSKFCCNENKTQAGLDDCVMIDSRHGEEDLILDAGLPSEPGDMRLAGDQRSACQQRERDGPFRRDQAHHGGLFEMTDE